MGYNKIDKLIKGDYAFAKGDAAASLTQLNSEEKKISIFPNPTNDLLNVYLPQLETESLQVSIYSEMGQLIQVHKVKQNENGIITMDVKTLPKGNYIITIDSKKRNKMESVKFQVH